MRVEGDGTHSHRSRPATPFPIRHHPTFEAKPECSTRLILPANSCKRYPNGKSRPNRRGAPAQGYGANAIPTAWFVRFQNSASTLTIVRRVNVVPSVRARTRSTPGKCARRRWHPVHRGQDATRPGARTTEPGQHLSPNPRLVLHRRCRAGWALGHRDAIRTDCRCGASAMRGKP